MKLHFVSLGCPKNSVDLETILGQLASRVEIVAEPEEADAVLVNTCAFITSAKEEAIETILGLAALKEHKPGLKLLVSGCLPQRYRGELEGLLPEVDAFFMDRQARTTAAEIGRFLDRGAARHGMAERVEILPAGNSCAPRYRLTPPHYAYLRIADGCDNRCTYCAIPLIKGDAHSRPLPEILAEAEQLAADGARELLVVAQDSTRYGTDLAEELRLHDVLAALNRLDGVRWVRLLYTHPAHWYEELIAAVASLDKVVPYIDLPLQHIADPLLKAMGRKTGRRQIEALIARLRESIPRLALRTSLIVGFPGESEAHFEELAEFVRQARFERLGVFAYSQEEGTAAAAWPDLISAEEKNARLQALMEIQSEISLSRNQSLVGERLEVVIDGYDDEEKRSLARTVWDAPEIDNTVLLDGEHPSGTFTAVTITDADHYDLYGQLAAAENGDQ